MKHLKKRGLALGLAIVLAVTPLASASEALGWDLYEGTTQISTDAYLTQEIFWSDTYSDLRTEHYITYTPSTTVTPTVTYGDYVLQRQTLTSMASSLENAGYRVVGGINGDFYTLSTGDPVGLIITDGVIQSSAPYYGAYAIGFYEDGSAIIGQPDMTITATFSDTTFVVGGGINHVRTQTGGYTLLTDEFYSTTLNTSAGIDVILSIVTDDVGSDVSVDRDVDAEEEFIETEDDSSTTDSSAVITTDEDGSVTIENGAGMLPDDTLEDLEETITLTQSTELTLGSHITCTVDAVLESTGAIDIPEGKLVLTIHGEGDAWRIAELQALQIGDTVEIDITAANSEWEEVDQALGALYMLVENGQVSTSSDSLWTSTTARTAVGIKEDGSLIFYTIDGLQSGYSVGATLTQVAKRLVELGCVTAVCMDGGGSTTLGTTDPTDSSFSLTSSPSGGTQRANSTAIFLTTQMTATGILDSFSITPSNSMVLAGSQVSLSASGIDTAYYPVSYSGNLTYSIDNGDGTITDDGTFTAGNTTEIVTVAVSGGGATGSTEFNVIANPDSIQVTNDATGATVSALTLSPGDSIDLGAQATYRTLSLLSSENAFTWSVDSALGTIDQTGKFIASTSGGSGSITIQAGTYSTTIPVTIEATSLALEDFETGNSNFMSTTNTAAMLETSLSYVRYGKQSLQVIYDTTEQGIANIPTTLDLSSGDHYLTLWLYGDNSSNLVSLTTTNALGETSDTFLTALDFTGWKQILVELPEDATSITSFQMIYGGADGMQSGTIWIDHLLTSSQGIMDTTAPTITMSLSGTTAMAQITDNTDVSFPQASISLTWDGTPLSFTWDETYSFLTATVPEGDSSIHRITVTATDVSGNISRSSLDYPATTEATSPFTDTSGHWAQSYAQYLYDTGVTNGIGEVGSLTYAPDQQITRIEFFAMVARWMDLDLTLYEDVTLPFADASSIPSWGLNEVKAMYALGILQGSGSGDSLLCNPYDTITRAEAMTILGRTQSKGYQEPTLTFTDSADVPSWALSYVSSLVGQGVVSGYNNLITPLNSVTRGEVAKMLYTMD